MKNILPRIKKEQAKLLHWYAEIKTTNEERKEITKRYKKLARIENKIIKKYF